MHSTLSNKPGDDPHDIVVVAPEAVRVAPDDEISDLLREAARFRSDTQARAASNTPADPMAPLLDTTFRPSVVDDVLIPVEGPSIARRLGRGLIALLLTAAIGLGVFAWKAYGDVAIKQIAKLATQVVMVISQPSEKPALAAQPDPPAVEAEAANPASAQPAPAAQTATEAAAPAAADPAPLLQSTARDLASLAQQVEQLKASIEQLKTGQQQISRDLAKASELRTSELRASEQNPRPKLSALPPRPAIARLRKPMPSYPPPQAAIAPALPPAVAASYPAAAPYPAPAPYYASRQPDYAPRPPEPQPPTTGVPLTDPELSSVPRPPMPVR